MTFSSDALVISKRTQILLAMLLLSLALFVPRLLELDTFVAVDEVNWLHRSANFYTALMRGDLSGTYVNRTPGVITSWIGSAAFRIVAPSYSVNREVQKTSYYMFELVLKEHGVHPLDVLVVSRILMILFLSVILLASFYYAIRLFGIIPALIGFLLLSFDPFVTALTRTSHLDAPQSVLMLLSLLALSSYLYLRPGRMDLMVSGVAGGMALLAKLPGLVILPTAGVLILICQVKIYQADQSNFRSVIWNGVKIFGGWTLAFTLSFTLLWPAMWVTPIQTLSGVIGQVFRYASTATQTVGLGEINLIPKEPGIELLSVVEPIYDLKYFLRYFIFFLWRSTPIVLVGLALFIIFSLKSSVQPPQWRGRLLGLWILVVMYFLVVTFTWKSSDKYFAPVFMLSCLVSGMGWYLGGEFLKNKTGKKSIQTGLITIVMFVQLLISFRFFPYYFSYYNPLLGGGKEASHKMVVGVGEGLDIAGRILNDIPHSSQLRVMSWYGIGPFSYYFDGQVYPIYHTGEELWSEEFINILKRMDFLVIYNNQKFRSGPKGLFELIVESSPVHTIVINNFEYAWIYSVRDLPFDDVLD